MAMKNVKAREWAYALSELRYYAALGAGADGAAWSDGAAVAAAGGQRR